MTAFGVASVLQLSYAIFLAYSLLLDPWYVRDYEPLAPPILLRSLLVRSLQTIYQAIYYPYFQYSAH